MSTQEIIFNTHLFSVILFLLIYLVKTILLLGNRSEALMRFTKAVKVPEMIVSFLFLGTGIYMLLQMAEIPALMIIKLVCVFASIPLAIIGFKKKNKALAVVSLLLIIGAYGLAEVSKKKSAGPVVDKSITEGKTLYEEKCTLCHGADGKLGLSAAADLTESTMDPVAAAEIIKNGKGMMAGFRKQLSDEQVEAVVKYIQGMKK